MVQRLKSKMPPRRFTRAAAENWELDSEGEDCEIDEQQAAELEGEAVNGCPHGTDHESQLAAAADSDPAFQAVQEAPHDARDGSTDSDGDSGSDSDGDGDADSGRRAGKRAKVGKGASKAPKNPAAAALKAWDARTIPESER